MNVSVAEIISLTRPAPLQAMDLLESERDRVREGTVIRVVPRSRFVPEAAAGGTIALVEPGDMIAIDIPNRTLVLEVPDEVLAERRKNWKPRTRKLTGYLERYSRNATSADTGGVLK